MPSKPVAVCDPIEAAASADLLQRLAEAKERRKAQLCTLVFDDWNESASSGSNDSLCSADLGFESRVAVALLAHRLRAAVFAAESRDHNLFQEARSPNSRLRHIVVSQNPYPLGISQAVLSSDPPKLGDTPSFLVSTESTCDPDSEKVELVARSFDTVRAFGGATVLSALGVVILMRQRRVFAQSNSWTTTSLDGTVYTDFVDDPVALGCEIIHESSHLWLNEVFAVCGFPFDDTETFYSPWKNTPRPRFGFLHAVFAFSMIACYCQVAIQACEKNEALDFLSLMLQKQRRNLVSVRDELFGALSPLNDELSRILLAAFERALELKEL